MSKESTVITPHKIVTGKFEIMPWDIPTKWDHLWSAFDHSETEVSAAYILRFCQSRESWAPFSYEDIETFYQRKRKSDHFDFNRLIEPGWHYGMPGERKLVGGGWIVHNPNDKMYYITDDFIRRVEKSAKAFKG